jgi:hypothetical protein
VIDDPLAFSTFVPIAGNAPYSCGLIFPPQRGPSGAAQDRQEEFMFKMTKGDLASKSNSQLFALFQEASKGLIATKSDLASAQSLLSMIRTELAKRGPSP